MGMLEAPKVFSEHFTEGQVFTLSEAKMGPEIATDYGVSRPVQLKIEGVWYSLFGRGLANQVERLESGELPARVAVVRRQTRQGQEVKLIVPEAQLTMEEDPPAF